MSRPVLDIDDANTAEVHARNLGRIAPARVLWSPEDEL